jgi:hypothetical protein
MRSSRDLIADKQTEEWGQRNELILLRSETRPPEMFADPAGCDLHLKLHAANVVGRAEKLRAPLTAADCTDDFNGRARRTDAPGDIGAAEHRNTPAGTK